MFQEAVPANSLSQRNVSSKNLVENGISKIWVQKLWETYAKDLTKWDFKTFLQWKADDNRSSFFKSHLLSGVLHLPDSESSGEQNPIHQSPNVLGSSAPSPNIHEKTGHEIITMSSRFHFLRHFCKEDRGKATTAQNSIEVEFNRIENSVCWLSFPLKMWELEMLCLHSI